jgi:ribosomal protein S18 acetylase RimI-like enzyme
VIDIVPFVEEHLHGVIRLCVAEGWPSFPEDPERAIRVLTAPGVTTVIAMDNGQVIGFAELFSDGELQAFLANVAVDERFRGRGTGRALVMEALRLAGGERIDLLSEDEAVGFYGSFPNFQKPGFRLYPFHHQGDCQPDAPQG